MTENNLDLWNAIGTTDSRYTKWVKAGRRGFTAIDAYYRIRMATEQFGPAGTGWGWDVKGVQIIGEMVIVTIHIWFGDGRGFGAVGQADTMTRPREGQPYPDRDSVKKALTDAVTKGLSYIGMCNDIFLGDFADNKYVDPDVAPPPVTPPPTDPNRLGDMIPADEVGAVCLYLVSIGWLEPTQGIENLSAENKAKIILWFDEFMVKVRERKQGIGGIA